MKRLAPVPFGAFCTHRRMRRRTCKGCQEVGGKPCCVECPDCGLGWMTGEGEYGYYFAGITPKTSRKTPP